ncbi:MAG: ATP-binding protein [Planctomycetota bacterium]
MRTDPLQSDAVELLRQSLEHTSPPALVVDSSTCTIVIANALARDAGFTAGDDAETGLLDRLTPPEAEREPLASALRNRKATVARWTGPHGPLTLRLQPLDTGNDPPLVQATWSLQPDTRGVPADAFVQAQRELHDWLARTPVTRSNLDGVIRDLCERICELYDLERAAVWLFTDDQQELRCRDLFLRSKREHQCSQHLHASECSAEFETLRRSLYVDVHDVATDPRAAGYRDSYLGPNGITSMLDAVIRFGGRCYGTLCLEHVGKQHVWQQHEIDFACKIASYLATALESLARSEAEAKVREREQFLRTLIDGSPVGIQVFAPDGTSRRMNTAMQRIIGLPSTTYDIGSYNLLNDPQAQSSGLDVVFRQALAGRPSQIARHEVHLGADGFEGGERRQDPFWLESVFFPVLDQADEVEAVVVFAWEVTDRVDAERKQQQLQEQLRQSQKLEAVGKLAGGVAHDFNNILTAVRGFTDVLDMELERGDGRRELVEQIRKGADRGAALTQQLLAFGQRQMTRLETIDAGNAIVEMMPMLRRLLEANIHVDVLASASATIHADRHQLQQVLLNLFVNARDAMVDGGTIEVRIGRVDDADGDAGGQMKLTVRDDGEGMDEATLRQVFEPFFTTKPDGVGTGLGLSTVYGIVHEAGGTITAHSEPGEGTSIEILWPLATETASPQTPHATQLHAQNGERVLVVEDDDANRQLATRVLTRYGYDVLSAPDGETALELVTSEDRIDVMLTDVVMPGIGGRLLAQEAAAVRPDLRIVFTSGYTSDDVLRHGVREHLVAFLPKPYSARQLAAIVAESLQR